MGSCLSCFKASSSHDPDEVDDGAVPWYLTPWLGLTIDVNRRRSTGSTTIEGNRRSTGSTRIDGSSRRSTGESSNAGSSRASSTVGDNDEDQSSANANIPITAPRISEEQMRSLPVEEPRIQGFAEQMQYLRQLFELQIRNDPQRSIRNIPVIYPAQSMELVRHITHGELPDIFTLSSEGNDIHLNVNIMAGNEINAGFDIYMERLFEARYVNVAPGQMIVPLRNVEPRRSAIWSNPRYQAMPRFARESKGVTKPHVGVVDTNKEWLKYAENFFDDRLRCQVSTTDSGSKALRHMGLIDDLPLTEQIGTLDLICVEYHMAERNGLEVLVKMKSSDTWKNTPFIMVSSQRDDPPSLINQCMEEGAVLFVEKPLLDNSDEIDLENWLRRILYQ